LGELFLFGELFGELFFGGLFFGGLFFGEFFLGIRGLSLMAARNAS